LSGPRDSSDGSSVSVGLPKALCGNCLESGENSYPAPVHSPISETSSSATPSPRTPPFSSLYFLPTTSNLYEPPITNTESETFTAYAPAPPFEETAGPSSAAAETKAALPPDTKGEPSSAKSADDGEPPPPYTEGSSPLESFTYVMAAAGGAASIITQVQQTGGPPINALGGMKSQMPQIPRRSSLMLF